MYDSKIQVTVYVITDDNGWMLMSSELPEEAEQGVPRLFYPV